MMSPRAIWQRLLGQDTTRELVVFGVIFAVYVFLDQVLLLVSAIPAAGMASSSLAFEAATANPVPLLALCAGAVAAVWLAPGSIFGPWSDLELGRVFRWFVIPLLVVQTWRHVTLDIDFLTGEWHSSDRVLLVVLAIAAAFRPVALVAWCFVARVLNEPLAAPSGNTSATNIDEFVIIVLLAIVAGLILGAAADRPVGDATLALIATIVATYLFAPGMVKLLIGWVQTNETENLALASYTAGFRGAGDGSAAQALYDTMQNLSPLVKLGTLTVELGAIVAILHFRLFRIWLLGPPILHISIFIVTGYWLMNWALLELLLLLVFWLPSVQPVARRNLTPARALLCAGIVAVPGFLVFHAPLLAWFDAPVSYGYIVEGLDEDGNRYSIDASAFAPYTSDVAFGRLVPTPPPVAVGGYGSTRDKSLIAALATVRTFEELEVIEASDRDNPRIGRPDQTEAFFSAFLEYWSEYPPRPWYLPQPPPRFHTSSRAPTAAPGDGGPEIVELELFRVTAIHASPELGLRQERLLQIRLDENGNAVILETSDTG